MDIAPLLPLAVLIPLAVLTAAGCAVIAVRTPKRRRRWIVRTLAVLVLAAAMLRPGVPQTVEAQRVQSSLDVFLLIDNTASMVAEDFDGDRPRLDGVREDVASLLEQMPGARVSVMTFSSTAQTIVPLTTDHVAAASALEVLRPEPTLYSSGSHPRVAADHLRERLERAEEKSPDSSRLVFYFGDGEDTSGGEQGGDFAAAAAHIDGGAVYGYGTAAGGRMRESLPYHAPDEQDPAYITDPDTGQPALSTIDEGSLREIAGALGVEYSSRADAAAEPAPEIPDVAQTVIDEEEQAGRSEVTWILFTVLFAWTVAEAVVAVVAIRRLLPERRAMAAPGRGAPPAPAGSQHAAGGGAPPRGPLQGGRAAPPAPSSGPRSGPGGDRGIPAPPPTRRMP